MEIASDPINPNRGMSRLILLLCLGWPLGLRAGEVQHGTVEHRDGFYILELDVVLDTGLDGVYAIVSDYDGLRRISDAIVEAVRLDSPNPAGIRRRLVIRTCILLFCFKGSLVEDVEESGRDLITTTIVPELSDFKSGRSEWRLAALEDGRSRIQLYSELEPGFWIPPVVGPWLMKRKMYTQALDTINRIEALAAGL